VFTIGVLVVLAFVLGLLLAWADQRYRPDTDTLIDAIDALLPQTQCAQCGYPGCRPYAEAVAAGAATNLCPPGGADTRRALARLLGQEGQDVLLAGSPLGPISPVTALIDERSCIGCYLCVPACPVDAIIGAPQLMHTVLQDACTGCELCLPACPVDCIDLVGVPAEPAPVVPERHRWPGQPALECIRCGACQPVCPVDLHPQQMLWFGASQPDPATAVELRRCIECGICNQVCPSNIDLVGHFGQARQRLARLDRTEQEATAAKDRFAGHQARLDARSAVQEQRRKDRIGARQARNWQA